MLVPYRTPLPNSLGGLIVDEKDQQDIKAHRAVVISQAKGCDFCISPALYDGKTTAGPWANMCSTHFGVYGLGLGLGLGQRLIVKEG